MACKEWAAKIGGGALGRVWALVAAFALLLGLAALAPAQAQAASFRDVPSGQWYTSWVDQASDQGLMSGFTDPATGRPTGYFGPDEPLTRAQVATVLWRMAGGPSAGRASFPDVERGSWYDAPVAWCVKAGVVTGYTSGPDKGCFRPNRPVTRQELATMVYRYAKYAGMDVADPDPSAFRSTTDWRTVDSWAADALTWTAAAGVLSGVDNHDGTYSVVPFGTATRAMAAKVFVVLSGSPSAAKASYTVTFNSNGGSAVKAQTVKNGAKASKSADPAKSGYTFKGWYSDKSLTKAYDFNSAVESDLTLHAKWGASAPAASYTVVFDSNGGSAVEAQTVEAGCAAVEPPAPTRPNCVFNGWRRHAAGYVDGYVDGTYNASGKGIGGEVPVTVTVKDGEIASVEVGPNSETPGIGSKAIELLPARIVEAGGTEGVDAVSGATVTSRAILAAVDECLAPSTAAPAWSRYDFGSPVESDITLFAAWAPAVRAVSFDSRGGTPVGSQVVAHGAKASRPADPARDGYEFAGWYADSKLMNCYDFSVPVTADLTLYAKWDKTQLYAILYSDGLLSLQKGSDEDASHGTVRGKWEWNAPSRPWYDKRARVRSVVVRDRVAVSNMREMFSGLSNCRSMDLSKLDVSSASDLSNMFSGCSSLASLDVSGWDVSNASSLSQMFSGCSSLGTVTLGVGCSSLVGELPRGPWYDAEGKEYDRPPAGVAGTFTKVKPEAQVPAADDAPAQEGDAAAPAEPSAPEQPSEPDTPAVEPGEPSDPVIPAEPGEPSDPEIPAEPEAPSAPSEPGAPGEPGSPAEPEAPSESEEPSMGPSLDEGSSDELAASDEGDLASDSLELGEDPVPVLAA